jgi:hypothetical protein
MVQTESLFSSRLSRVVALVFLFGLALSIRLYDLTDLPLDFHPTRQLVSVIKARALYYETEPDGIPTWKLETAIRQAQLQPSIEPTVMENLVAFVYRFTGEQIWIARVYSSLFWLAGGVFLYLLVRELVSEDGALLSLAYYLFLPYAVIASRSFQPDPLMVTLILAFWWTFYRWTTLTLNPSPSGRGEGVRAALLAGLLGGFAIYVKFSAAFFVIGAALGLALARFTLRDLMRSVQLWMIVLLGCLPTAAYLVYGLFIGGFLGQQFTGRFIPSLLLNPLNYLQWEAKASLAAGGPFIMLALLGFLLAGEKRLLRSFLVGIWGAYILYGLFFNYHVATHDYYHLPFIPVVAVSLSPLGEWFAARLTGSAVHRVQRSVVYVILIYGLLSVTWDVRNELKRVDYRPQAAMWAEIGERLEGRTVVALTQDYGYRLEYWGWRTVDIWPRSGDFYYTELLGGAPSVDELIEETFGSRDYFLVTDFEELKRQGILKETLARHPVYAEGDGYVIYSLRETKE